MWHILKITVQAFQQDKVTRLAAAVSFYTTISIAPLMVIVLSVLGFFIGDNLAETQLLTQLRPIFGQQAVRFIEVVVHNTSRPTLGTVTGVISVLTLVWGSTNIFAQFQNALNVIWGVEDDVNSGLSGNLRQRAISFGMAISVGILLFLSLIGTAVFTALSSVVADVLPEILDLWRVVEIGIGMSVATLLFGLLFKVLPGVGVPWRHIWPGALVASLLFHIGQVVIAYYLSFVSLATAYGAASSVLVFLIWVYYATIILFFGAEFSHVLAQKAAATQ